MESWVNKTCCFCTYMLSIKCQYAGIIGISPNTDACCQYRPVTGAKEYAERRRIKKEFDEMNNPVKAKETRKEKFNPIEPTKRSIEF